jgi:hypothetical protein
MHRLPAIVISILALLTCTAFDAASSRGMDLSGTWKLNTALSDDAERMLAERMEKERQRYAQWRREEERMQVPPIDVDSPGASRSGPSAARRASQQRRDENLRRMLAISDTLTVQQTGSTVDITSAVESRRLVAGSRTQVSMPEGELADSKVGWDGQWFVIDRKVSRGPRVLEKYRVLPKTGQLEYTMAWSGDSELSGMKVRRLFDRASAPPPPPDPAAGPVR